MGRMFDAFQQAGSRRAPATSAAPVLPTIWPEDEAEPSAAPDEEMPFIEVGGPRAPAEAAVPIPAPVLPVVPSVVRTTVGVETRLMSVRFRPLPAESPALRSVSRFSPELVAFHQPDHAISEQYRDLATNVLMQLPTEQPRVLLFTSNKNGAGTTTVLLNTAITLAKQNRRRVVVVDAHLRRPALSERLGLAAGPGLRDVLSGLMPAEEVVQVTALPGFAALTAGEAIGVAPARLAGESMRSVLWHLRERYDLVLVDGPCWDGRPEVVALGCACDSVYLCVPEADQETVQTGELLQVITEQGASLRGCILTSR
jgi:Mrp family chromosome partitioning ATPase